MAAILENKMADTSYVYFVVIFGFSGLENMIIETKIRILFLVLAEIWDFDNLHGGHFEKWPPQPPQVKSGWGPVFKKSVIGYCRCVPNFILVSQSARFSSK